MICPHCKEIIIPKTSQAENIILLCADHFGVSVSEIKSKTRKDEAVKARHLAMFLIKTRCRLSLASIAEIFNRHHTSVIHAIKRIHISNEYKTALFEDLQQIAA